MTHRQIILRPEGRRVGLVRGGRDRVRDGAIVAPPGPHVLNARAAALRGSRGNGVTRAGVPGKRLGRTVSCAVNGERETCRSCLNSHLDCRCRCSRWVAVGVGVGVAPADGGQDIDPAPSINVVWRSRSATLGGSDMNSRVIQGCPARVDLVLQARNGRPEQRHGAGDMRSCHGGAVWQTYRHYRSCYWPNAC